MIPLSPGERRGPRRVYANDAIAIDWEPSLCIHTGNCTHGLGEVFDAQARPWVDVNAADPDRIAATVLTCPTGALHYRRLDDGPPELPATTTTVELRPNGPLVIRGRVRIVDSDGHLIREDSRLALCRCGASENKPFCDGSHRRIGVQAGPGAPGGVRDDRTRPGDTAIETGGSPEPRT
jgi:CDGSH-type Zn-finger protein/uncharacterized Fe-S cluster protein YjdI